MRKLLFAFSVLLFCFLVRAGGGRSYGSSPETKSLFDTAIACIKVSEGWHTIRDAPYIGYGHKILPGEKLTACLTEGQADSLLRSDLKKRCVTFRNFGKDSLLLATLAYNVGEFRLLGYGKIPKSRLIRKLEVGDRDIYKEYVSFRIYQGKVLPSLEKRRKREFELLYIP